MAMERGVVPRKAMAVAEGLEARDEALGELRDCGEIGRIAIVDAATQRSHLPRRTATRGILPWARVSPVERTPRSRGPLEEELDLNRRDEKGMSVLAKTTAPAADLTDRP
jgi:hypothetical protein